MPAKKQFSFFATQDDLIGVLATVATKTSYHFVNVSDIDDETPSVYTSVSELADLSIAVFGDQNKEKTFLLIASDAKPKTR